MKKYTHLLATALISLVVLNANASIAVQLSPQLQTGGNKAGIVSVQSGYGGYNVYFASGSGGGTISAQTESSINSQETLAMEKGAMVTPAIFIGGSTEDLRKCFNKDGKEMQIRANDTVSVTIESIDESTRHAICR